MHPFLVLQLSGYRWAQRLANSLTPGNLSPAGRAGHQRGGPLRHRVPSSIGALRTVGWHCLRVQDSVNQDGSMVASLGSKLNFM